MKQAKRVISPYQQATEDESPELKQEGGKKKKKKREEEDNSKPKASEILKLNKDSGSLSNIEQAPMQEYYGEEYG